MAASILRSVGFIVVFCVFVWLFGEFTGFEINLMGTLFGSILLTVIATVLFNGFRRLSR